MVLPRSKPKEFDLGDALASMGDTLSRTAYRPNINHYEPWFKQEWFHQSDKHGRLFIGGNRTGKTVSNVVECIWWLTKTHPYKKMPKEPVRGRYVTVDFKNFIKPLTIPEFQRWLPTTYLINGNWNDSYDKETDTLHLTNGSTLQFRSYEQEVDKFAGASLHFVAFDEEPDQLIWNECLARLVDTNGYWWMSMTPLFGMTWVYDKIYEPAIKDPENFMFFMVQADMAENPHLGEAARKMYLATLSDEEREARQKGNFVQAGGLVYKTYRPHIHQISGKDFKLTSDMRVYMSLDGGWTHPAGLLWHAVKPDGSIVTFKEMRDIEVTIPGWCNRIKEYERTLRYWDTGQKAPVYLRTGDPALRITRAQTGLSDLMEYASNGIYFALENVPSGPGSVDTGIKKMVTYLAVNPRTDKPMWQHTDDCFMLRGELQKYRWETWANKKMENKNAPKTKPHSKDDDLCDSLRYFISIQSDLSFDTSVPTPQVSDRLGAVADTPLPLIDKPDILGKNDYRDFASLDGDARHYQLYDETSGWDMEW